MHALLSETLKVDVAIEPQSSGSAVNSEWYPVENHDKLYAVLLAGSMAASATNKIKMQQAKDSSGSSSKALGSEATITANSSVLEATITLSSVVAGNQVTVNGTTLTADTEFAVGSTDTITATNLASAINSNVTGVTASSSSTVVTVKPTDPDDADNLVTLADGDNMTLATVRAGATSEVQAADLDDDFTHVRLVWTPSTSQNAAALLIRSPLEMPASQAVAAEA